MINVVYTYHEDLFHMRESENVNLRVEMSRHHIPTAHVARKPEPRME